MDTLRFWFFLSMSSLHCACAAGGTLLCLQRFSREIAFPCGPHGGGMCGELGDVTLGVCGGCARDRPLPRRGRSEGRIEISVGGGDCAGLLAGASDGDHDLRDEEIPSRVSIRGCVTRGWPELYFGFRADSHGRSETSSRAPGLSANVP